jgi:hypothetical protein
LPLGGNSCQIFKFKRLMGKIFQNKDLRDPFASLKEFGSGLRFAHAR